MRTLLLVLLLLASCASQESPPPPEGEPAVTRHTAATAGGDKDPEVSPDGKSLLFATNAWGPHYDLYVKAIDGKVSTRITTADSDERFPAVNPRRPEMLAFSSNREGEWDVFLIRDYRRRPDAWVRVSPRGSDDLHPSWSPDGSRLVYSSLDTAGNGRWILKVFDLPTGRTDVLEEVEGLLPEWNPKDDRIVFQRMRERNGWLGSIWTVRVEGGRALDLTAVYSGARWAAINPTWTPDGERIVFATVGKAKIRREIPDDADDLWIVGADGSRPTRLTTHPASDWMPRCAPDGRIFFVSSRSGRNHIWSLHPRVP